MSTTHDEIKKVAKAYQIRTIIVSVIAACIIVAPMLALVGNKWDMHGLIIGLIVSGSCGITVGFLSTKMNINKFISPMEPIINYSESVAFGDISQEIGTDERLGRLEVLRDSLNNMVLELRTAVTEIKFCGQEINGMAAQSVDIAENCAEGAQLIASTVNEIADGASNQAMNLQEANIMVKDMVHVVENIRQKTVEVSQHTSNTEKLVKDGLATAKYQMEKVKENAGAMVRVSESIKSLEDQSNQIGQIVHVITDIASQTNLLALNAAIEAAKAGDQGRGFAVVAEEVRKLAEETSSAAKKIFELIEEIQAGTSSVVGDMEKVMGALENQTEAVVASQNVLQEMANQIEPITAESRIIADAAHSISTEAEKTVADVENIASASEETAAASEEVLASTEDQEASVNRMRGQIRQFSELASDLQQEAEKIKTA
ncbi:MAG: methyl-accepting chemotaxis protein [Acidobacteriota bacterium]